MDLDKSKNILKCLSLRGREGSSSQMGVAHLCGLKTMARKRRERGNSTLSLFFVLSLAFCLPGSFLPLSGRHSKMRVFTLSQWWHRDRKLTGPKVVARLKISLCMQLPHGCLLLPMPSLPCALVS